MTNDIELYKKDERVLTPLGIGTVTRDENILDRKIIRVRLDSVPDGLLYDIRAWDCSLFEGD